VIGLSAYTEAYRDKCLNNGMEDFITKPVNLKDLIKVFEGTDIEMRVIPKKKQLT
jgi:CheY-like chemotaxis protein